MKTRTLLALSLICLAALSGCTFNKVSDDGGPTISEAVFLPGEAETIRITGEYFKIKSDNKIDVVVSLNGRNWMPAKKILESSPTVYLAEVPYGPDFPQVWVRVFGMNGEYSSVHLVHVAR